MVVQGVVEKKAIRKSQACMIGKKVKEALEKAWTSELEDNITTAMIAAYIH